MMNNKDYEAEYIHYIQEHEGQEEVIKKIAQERGVDEITAFKTMHSFISQIVTRETLEMTKDEFYWDSIMRIIKLVDTYNFKLMPEKPLNADNVLLVFDVLLQVMMLLCINNSPTDLEATWIGGFSSFGNALKLVFQDDEMLKNLTWENVVDMSEESFQTLRRTVIPGCRPYLDDYFFILAKLSAYDFSDVLHVPVVEHITALHKNIEGILCDAMMDMETEENGYLNTVDKFELQDSILETCLYKPWNEITSIEKEKINQNL